MTPSFRLFLRIAPRQAASLVFLLKQTDEIQLNRRVCEKLFLTNGGETGRRLVAQDRELVNKANSIIKMTMWRLFVKPIVPMGDTEKWSDYN